MTKPANSAFSKDRLRDITVELRQHGPRWATRLSRVKTEQEFLQTVCELFNLANTFTADQDNSLNAEDLSSRIGLFISENIHKGVTLKLLSQFLGYSEKYCSDLFHNTMGESFSDYLKHRRLERATLLLTATEKGMAEIATALGFSDQFAFSHFFKRATGQSPIHFRLQHGRRPCQPRSLLPEGYR